MVVAGAWFPARAVEASRQPICIPSLPSCLQALAKYAFGLGFLQMLVCTALFTAMALPAGRGIMTQFLEVVLHASPSLVSIRSVDEAVVIGVALSLSSSAFVLQVRWHFVACRDETCWTAHRSLQTQPCRLPRDRCLSSGLTCS